MQTADLNKELLHLETRFWESLRDKDVDAALRLADDPCIVTGPQGVAQISKKTFAKMMKDDTSTVRDFKLTDVTVQRLSDDVAVIGYKVQTGMTVDGKPVAIDAADTSTWVRKDGKWVCAAHTESITGDPYGRDRASKH